MMIRIASPSVVFPLALRAIGSNSTALIFASQQSKYSHSSSVASREDSVNAILSNAFLNEINSIKSNMVSEEVKKAPDDFPFEIVDRPRFRYYGGSWLPIDFRYDRGLVLVRKLPDGEEVRVAIDMRKKDIKAIPMTVVVYKHGNDSECTEFEITLSEEDITVERFTFFPTKDNECISGSKFKEMNSVVQQWLRKYLEMRGIRTNVASYLLEYIDIKNKKAAMRMLNDLNNYIFH